MMAEVLCLVIMFGFTFMARMKAKLSEGGRGGIENGQ